MRSNRRATLPQLSLEDDCQVNSVGYNQVETAMITISFEKLEIKSSEKSIEVSGRAKTDFKGPDGAIDITDRFKADSEAFDRAIGIFLQPAPSGWKMKEAKHNNDDDGIITFRYVYINPLAN